MKHAITKKKEATMVSVILALFFFIVPVAETKEQICNALFGSRLAEYSLIEHKTGKESPREAFQFQLVRIFVFGKGNAALAIECTRDRLLKSGYTLVENINPIIAAKEVQGDGTQKEIIYLLFKRPISKASLGTRVPTRAAADSRPLTFLHKNCYTRFALNYENRNQTAAKI